VPMNHHTSTPHATVDKVRTLCRGWHPNRKRRITLLCLLSEMASIGRQRHGVIEGVASGTVNTAA